MIMNKLRINEAINAFNETRRVNEPKMTQKLLALTALKDKEPNNAINYISRLCKGKTSKIDIESVDSICRVLNCDPNYLFNFSD